MWQTSWKHESTQKTIYTSADIKDAIFFLFYAINMTCQSGKVKLQEKSHSLPKHSSTTSSNSSAAALACSLFVLGKPIRHLSSSAWGLTQTDTERKVRGVTKGEERRPVTGAERERDNWVLREEVKRISNTTGQLDTQKSKQDYARYNKLAERNLNEH